jgi:hypothetical protein
MTTSTTAPSVLPTANNDQYLLSIGTVYRQLRNRGWHVLSGIIASRFSSSEESMTGAEFRELLISYCQANPLSMDAIADNGDGFLKIMVEACEMQRSSW